jgi:hypothetical protein
MKFGITLTQHLPPGYPLPDQVREGVPEEERQQIVRDNARRLYAVA